MHLFEHTKMNEKKKINKKNFIYKVYTFSFGQTVEAHTKGKEICVHTCGYTWKNISEYNMYVWFFDRLCQVQWPLE